MPWKEFLSTQPALRVVHLDGDLNPDTNFKDLPWHEKISLLNASSYDIIIRCDNGIFFIGYQIACVKRIGRNIFKKKEWISYIRIEGNKSRSHNMDYHYSRNFIRSLGITWCRDLSNMEFYYMGKPSILKKMLLGKVYSQETLWKAIASTCFHAPKTFPWRLLKDYVGQPDGLSPTIADLLIFTKTPTVSAEKIMEANMTDHEKFYLMCDLVKAAALLQETVDLSWSTNRMRKEHNRQIRDLAMMKRTSLTDDEIQETRIGNDSIRMLNTEREVYSEGEAMSHCLFMNYMKDIKDKVLLAFHMSNPEDCTFSVELMSDNRPVIQQIFLSHNRHVRDSTKDAARAFVEQNTERIAGMLAHNKSSSRPAQMDYPLEDFPF